LLRIKFSDGSYLDCTPNHKFSIESNKYLGIQKYKEVEAKDLNFGDVLEYLEVKTEETSGEFEENAFEWGFFAGDGYLEKDKIKAVVCGDKSKLFELGLKGKLGKPQIKEGYTDPVNRVYLTDVLKNLEIAKELNNKDLGVPEYFFSLDVSSLLEFVAGWIETDGTIQKNERSWNYRIYGSEKKMLDLQLILRRAGVNGVTVSLASEKGSLTNFGERHRDLFYVTIPSSESYKIPTRYKVIPKELISSGYAKNNAYKNSKEIKLMKRQKVEEIEVLDGEHSTFCFTENERHMGVFGNVLTKQCNLVELIPSNHTDIEDFKQTIKYAYLFAKTITLLNTNWSETNKVMLRNRRIGLSITGITQFIAERGTKELKQWMEDGYDLIEKYDDVYSEWFAIPKSIKRTTVKPSGTLSLLAGVTPGIHFPESRQYIRRVRLSKNSPYVSVLKKGNYHVEDANEDPENTCVVEFPVSLGDRVKTINETNIWEQMNLASFAQENWADNSVSVTVTFKENEVSQIKSSLDIFQFKLKSVSFLPKLSSDSPYPQMPYEEITEKEYEKRSKNLLPLDFSEMLSVDSKSEMYCESDVCMVL